MKRTRLRPISEKRQAQNALRRELMVERFGLREEWKCSIAALGSCYGPVNGHERVKRSQGGSITDMDNIILLCNFHNDYVEDNPTLARELGLSRHGWESR